MSSVSLLEKTTAMYDVFSDVWDTGKQGIVKYSSASMSKSEALK